MPSFWDRFRDLDSLKEQAEELIQQGIRGSKRQAALAKLRYRVFELERRMNSEFRVLGEKVWDLHKAEAVTPENLAGAYTVLEALANEIAESKDELNELLSSAREAGEDADDEPAVEAGEAVDAERRIEPDDEGRPEATPLE